MEYLDPNYRKRHERILLAGYALLAILIGLIAGLVYLQASGYSIDVDGEIKQNSLVFLDSSPSGAKISLNGELIPQSTNTRINVAEGTYTIKLEREGYLPWTKTARLDGLSVNYYKYPFLFPANKVTDVIGAYNLGSRLYQSPDKKRLLVPQPIGTVFFDVYSLNSANVTGTRTTLNLSSLVQDNRLPDAIEVLEWAKDNRTILAKAIYGDTTQYWLVDIDSQAAPTLISQDPANTIAKITLVDNDIDRLHILTANSVLSSYDPSTAIYQSLLSNVVDYETHGDSRILYATNNAVTGESDIYAYEDAQTYKITTLPLGASGDFELDMAEFEGNWYFAVGSLQSGRLKIYKNPVSGLKRDPNAVLIPVSNIKVDRLVDVGFSTNARFVAGSHAEGIVVYDAELHLPYRYQLEGMSEGYQITWMDGHRLVGQALNNLKIWEFDGMNVADFTPVTDYRNVMFDEKYESMYYLKPTESGSELQQELLTVR